MKYLVFYLPSQIAMYYTIMSNKCNNVVLPVSAVVVIQNNEIPKAALEQLQLKFE